MKKLLYILLLICRGLSAQDTLPVIYNGLPVIYNGDLGYYIEETEIIVQGVLDFDGVDDYVSFSQIDLSGSNTVTFKLFVDENLINDNREVVFNITPSSGTRYSMQLGGPAAAKTVLFQTSITSSNNYGFYISEVSNFYNNLLEFEIIKTSNIDVVKINGVTISNTFTGSVYLGNGFEIGRSSLSGNYLKSAYIWDININDAHSYLGQPSGNTNGAWVDNIGSNDGTVFGSPTTKNLP